ncbi:MAG: hypothetical protein AB4040_15555 [Synechococcus sp.]
MQSFPVNFIHSLMEAVAEALKQTPRASSLVENLNSRLRNYLFPPQEFE